MLFRSYEVRDFSLPFLYLSLIIGYQIVIYFLLQYYKVREEKLELNKILLAYSVFFGIALTGYLIQIINNNYIIDSLLIYIFIKIIYILFYLSIFVFLCIISSRTFYEILPPILTKIIAIITIIPVIFLIIFQPKSTEFYFTLIFILIGGVYILIFQFKLIKISTGNIKRRLIVISIGGTTCAGAILKELYSFNFSDADQKEKFLSRGIIGIDQVIAKITYIKYKRIKMLIFIEKCFNLFIKYKDFESSLI